MAVKLRLMRMGKTKQPTYRVVAADSRSPRNGRFIETTGKREPLDVKVGDRVVYAKYAGSEIKLDETEYLILSEKDILAVVANGKS